MVALSSQSGSPFLIPFLWNLQLVLAGIVNRTIDDGFGDSDTLRPVTYFPTSYAWQNATCKAIGCLSPDVSKAFNGTYTAATYFPPGSISITMKFNGTAIYVFFILANNAGDGITALTLANFTLDGTNPELYQHLPDLMRTDIDYNQLVYSKQDLVNAEHTLVISTSDVNYGAYVNFDYAIYTHDDEAPLLPFTNISQDSSGTSLPNTSDTKSTPPVGPIVGGVIGGVVLLLLVLFFLLFCRRRCGPGRHKSEAGGYIPRLMQSRINPQASIITPFNAQPTQLGLYPITFSAANASDGEERADPNSVRRARHNEINERLRMVQQEVTRLTSDLREEQKLLVGQRRASIPARNNQEVGEEEEMTMAEMREQLSVMKEQMIEILREQQRLSGLRSFGPDIVPPNSS